jgi:hypothetical protein
MICDEGFIIPVPVIKLYYPEKTFAKFLNVFTVIEKLPKNHPKGLYPKKIRAYKIERGKEKDYIILPKISAKLFEGRVKIKFKMSDAVDIKKGIIPYEPLFDYQDVIVDYIVSKSINKFNYTYLQLETGYGKTRTACHLILRFAVKTVIIVPTKAIGNQWKDELEKTSKELNVMFYQNSSGELSLDEYDVFIGVINTMREKEIEFFSGIGFMILDEAHEYCSNSNSKILWLSQQKYVLGLSATPNDSPNGMGELVKLHLGEPVFANKIPDFNTDQINFRFHIDIINYFGNPECCETYITPNGTVSAIGTIHNIIQDTFRLNLIIEETHRLFTENDSHGIYIFAEHRDFLPILQEALLEKFKEDDIFVPEIILRGGSTHADLTTAKKCRIVLTTFGFSRRGISLVDMNCIILATSRRSGSKQILGRIMRRGSDEKIIRQVVDIVDCRTCLKNQILDRVSVYKERDYEITSREIKYNSET